MKFLVIVALFALLLLLLYSRVHPYLQALKKILTAARTMTDSAPAGREVGKTDSRLVRCVGCGTWVPADRTVGSNSGSSVYCSRECLEKKSDRREKKLTS